MTRSVVVGFFLALFYVVGCSPDVSNPEGAAKAFVRAVAMRDGPKIYEMLAPEAQTQLKEMAALATAQTGGRRRFTPDELLAAGLDQPRYRLSRVHLETERGERATVLLLSAHDKERETLKLIKIDGRWRVILPEGAMKASRRSKPTSPASAPASAPTSSPARVTSETKP